MFYTQPGALAAIGLVTGSNLALVAAALVAPLPVFVVAALLALAVEAYLLVVSADTKVFLEKLGVSRVYRQLARDLAAVIFLVATVRLTRAETVIAMALPALVWAMSMVTGVAVAITERRDRIPVLTRNIKLGDLDLPRRAPMWMVRAAGDRLPYVNVALLAGAVVASATDSFVPYLIGAGIAVAAATAMVVGFAAILWLGRRTPPRHPVLTAVEEWLLATRSEVMLYFAGPAKDVYQANMWLNTLAALDQPAIILMRSAEAFRTLAPTKLPVICVPRAVDLMNLSFQSVRVAFYPTNVGPNIHMLREPGMKHVFIGHGDSDKQASVNPYSKVYDEVWVAGPAGRERYARAGVGVLDSDIVEIGRPQLAAVETTTGRAADRPFTVLYAPTWEGWIDDPYHTSLILMGESIIRGLLEASPAVRVVYKPHPLTGTRSKQVHAIHDRLVRMIRAAGGDTDATSLDGTAHLVVTRPTPALFDCFNRSDLLISDVSSVVADYVQSQRPYVVANPSGMPEDEFRRTFPTARAAYLLSRDSGELFKILDLARSADDPMREARRELKTYLLGPDEPSSLEQFRRETTRLSGH